MWNFNDMQPIAKNGVFDGFGTLVPQGRAINF
jgi:hypothetical protein